MKKFFSLVAAVLFASSMMAETAVLQYPGGSTTNMSAKENNAAKVGLDADLFTVLSVKGKASNEIGLNKVGDIRLYADKDSANGNTLTVSINGGIISSIALDIKQAATYTVTAGEAEVTGADNVFEIKASSFAIKNVTIGENKQLQLNKITIEYALAGVLSAPSIFPANTDFEDSLDITISAEEGAKIYYTLNGDTPTVASIEYAAPFTIKESTTVKAIAVKDSTISAIAEKNYHKIEVLNVADAIKVGMALDSAATSEVEYTVIGYVVDAQEYSLVHGNQIWFMADSADNAANQKFEAYACVAKEDTTVLQAINGDKVKLTGKITKYYSTQDTAFLIEISKGVAEFIEKVDSSHALPTIDTISVKEALEIGKALKSDAKTNKPYVIEGYVSYIVDLYDPAYKNETFWIADSLGSKAKTNDDGAFYVYRGLPTAEKEIGYGAKVQIQALIYNYKGNTIENSGTTPVVVLEEGAPMVIDTITVEEAEAITAELAEEEETSLFYVVKGFATTVYEVKSKAQTWYMADYPMFKSDFQASSCSFDSEVKEGDYMLVTGHLCKHKTSSGKILSQIYKGKAIHTEAPKIDTIFATVAEAIEVAKALQPEKGQELYAEGFYAVKGYIIKISTKGDIFYLADDPNAKSSEFRAYNCAIADTTYEAEEGDLIMVTGRIQHYYGETEDKQEYHNYQIHKGMVEAIRGEGIEDVVLTEKAQKVVVDGVLYIVRDEKMYNVQGTQVR